MIYFVDVAHLRRKWAGAPKERTNCKGKLIREDVGPQSLKGRRERKQDCRKGGKLRASKLKVFTGRKKTSGGGRGQVGWAKSRTTEPVT